jgi:hypothetical protein
MSTPIAGTNVAAPVVPFTTSDTYPTHDPVYGIGGWREVADLAARNAIPPTRLRVGCVVVTLDTNTPWQLTASGWIDYRTNGLKGDKGDTGEAGTQGIPGIPGPAGKDGQQGADGQAGPQGIPGFDGAPGTPGKQGAQGIQGPAGATGPQGIAGLGLTNRRDWVSGTVYNQGDYVFRPTQGGTTTVTDTRDVSYNGTVITYNGFDVQYGTVTTTSGSGSPSGAGNSIFVANFVTYTSVIEPHLDPDNWSEVYAPQGPQGIQGVAGPQGPTGANGAPGLQGLQGPPGADGKTWKFRGAWAPKVAYALNDVFTYGGSSYITTVAFTSTATFSTANAAPLALKGDSGQQGIPGTSGTGGGSTIVPVDTSVSIHGTVALQFPASGSYAYDYTLVDDTIFTVSGGVVGQLQKLTILVRQPSSAGFSVTLPSNVLWDQNTPPVISETPNNFTVFTISTLDGGKTLLGNMA